MIAVCHDGGARSGQYGLVKGLGLIDATTIVMGSMIGSGIFLVSADIARQVQSPGLLILTWVVTAVLTVIAALSYGELAAMMPEAGGQYVYLREAFGPLSGFLYGWTLFLVIQTGTIAAVAVAFAKYTGVFFPVIASDRYLMRLGPVGLNTQQALAILVLVLLTWVNTRGVRTGAKVQNVFTVAKTAGLLGLVGFGFLAGDAAGAAAGNFSDFWRNADWSMTTIRTRGRGHGGSAVLVGRLEQRHLRRGRGTKPRRDVPLALGLGVGIVSAIYLASNLVYLRLLPLEGIQHAAEDRVATAAAAHIFGPVAVQIMAAVIMISTFGCINGMVAGGRAGLLCHGAGRPVLQAGGETGPGAPHPGGVAGGAVRLGLPADAHRDLQQPARLRDLRGASVLHADHRWALRAAPEAAGGRAALPRAGLSFPARFLHRAGGPDRGPAADLQAGVHVAGADHRAPGRAGVLPVWHRRRAA